MRLGYLFLRSRMTGPSLACLLGVTAVTWQWAWWVKQDPGILFLIVVMTPLAAATVIGVSCRSPFGEAERTAGRWLPALRLGHLAGLLLLGGGALAVVGRGWAEPDGELALVRNVAGLAGLAFLAARVVGGGLSWIAPLGYVVLAFFVGGAGENELPRWAWVVQPAAHEPSRYWAAGLLAAGLLAIAFAGARESPDAVE